MVRPAPTAERWLVTPRLTIVTVLFCSFKAGVAPLGNGYAERYWTP